jgi:hypothetical protein
MPAKAQNEIHEERRQILEQASPRHHELLIATEPELKAEAIERYVARLTASENQLKLNSEADS